MLMKNKKMLIMLSDSFFVKYDRVRFPEILQKRNRPYILICIEIDGVPFALPLRSSIRHNHAFWTDEENRCGVDYSKAVVISQLSDIDEEGKPYIRQSEFLILREKRNQVLIQKGMKRYIKLYQRAKRDLSIEFNRNLVTMSSLQYFEEYLTKTSEQYAGLTENVELKLDEADIVAKNTNERLTHDNVFGRVRKAING